MLREAESELESMEKCFTCSSKHQESLRIRYGSSKSKKNILKRCGAPERISYGYAVELGLVANKDLRALMAFPKGCSASCEVVNPLHIPGCLNKSGFFFDSRKIKMKKSNEKIKLRTQQKMLQQEQLSSNARNVWFVYDEHKISNNQFCCEAIYQCHRHSDCKWNYYCNILFLTKLLTLLRFFFKYFLTTANYVLRF